MKPKLFALLILLLWTSHKLKSEEIKKIKHKTITNLVVRWNPNELRIPGKSFEIGFEVEIDGKTNAQTKGYLEGSLKWSNFKVKVDKGRFFNGKITLSPDISSKKGEYLTIKIYKRKGKEFIKEQKIPFNYETTLTPLLEKNITKAPGSKIKLGIRTYFDNEKYVNNWSKKISDYFSLQASGGYIRNGKLFINEDPLSIKNHTVSVKASLIKSPDITCNFSILLDYKKHYTYTNYGIDGINGRSGDNGPNGSRGNDGANGGHGGHGSDGYRSDDIEVFVDAYYDTILSTDLIYAEVTNLNNRKSKKYLINPVGGSLDVRNIGGNGGYGGDGGNGGDGGRGLDGATHQKTVHVNDSTTKIVTWQDEGFDGGNGGSGGCGGNGGFGGNGGDIFVVYTRTAEPYLDLIEPMSSGGSAGLAGIGGSQGRGGAGGSGDPEGRPGRNGRSGCDGESGYSGEPGRVEWHEANLSDP